MNPAGIKAQLEQMREEAKPKLPWQEGAQTGENGGFRPIEDSPESALDQGVWGVTPPPETNNTTGILPIPPQKEPLPFGDDSNIPKTDVDTLFQERNK